jgi:hypothetical protein
MAQVFDFLDDIDTDKEALMIQALHSALAGIQLNLRNLDSSASRISRIGAYEPGGESPPIDLAREFVDMIVAKHGVSANLRVVETVDEMLGLLVDRRV